MSGLDEAVENTFRRWDRPPMEGLTKEQVRKMMAISLGLGALFNESVEAERDWMNTPHPSLKTRPITAILAGDFDDVLDVVNLKRGLY